MTATAEPPAPTVEAPPPTQAQTHLPLDRGEGVELLGDIHGCGYRDGACLVRRRDGQMVQLGPLMYGLLEAIDGRRDSHALADALSERLGRRVKEEHVLALAQKLAAQGLLAGFEEKAPPRRNPLLALRWKVLVTNPTLTRRLTTPFTFLFRPWIMWPILACFAAVFWFVLIQKGVGSATAEAFHKPGLFLIVFVLAIVSAGLHELGHAAAARYGGATPGGMGMGLYLVWPAFYTDVTDAYRLPRRDRLRVDLAGLYFNAAVAVITMAAWLLLRIDALLLLVALQVLQMIKQLSPVIRADGYHILSDATGVPDLFAHMIPTLRRLLPGHRREPSALTARARLLVTVWVLIVVPVLLSLMIGAIVLLPHLATSAWDSGRHIASAISRDASQGQVLDLLAGVVSLVALVLPVLGSVLVTQKIVRTTVYRAHDWSRGRPVRRSLVLVAGAAAIAGVIWAWWPSGQYQPIPARGGTLSGLVQLVSSPASMARPTAQVAPVQVPPGTHLALSMIPVGGATKKHPALFIIKGQKGKPPVAIYTTSTPPPPTTPGPVTQTQGAGSPTTTSTSTPASSTPSPPSGPSSSSDATAFPFKLPAPPGPGGTQALAENTTNGGVKYDVAYSLVTVSNGAPVTNTNSAFALAHCQACTTVAVSFQVVLVIGQSKDIAPINAAGALNYDCPACTTTAIADQIVITLKSQPSQALLAQLEQALEQLGALPALGAGGTPDVVASQVATVQQGVETALNQSGLVANPPKSSSTSSSSTSASGPATTSGTSTTGTASNPSTTPTTESSPTSTSPSSSSSGSPSSSTTSTSSATPTGPSTTTTSSSPTPTTTASSTTSTTSP